MELKLIKKLLEFVQDTDIEELHWEKEGTKVIFRRGNVPLIKKGKVSQKEEKLPTTVEPGLESGPSKKIFTIKSPMVGTFYRASSPNHPAILEEGSMIKPGQKVCVIEAMKINKDVISDQAGKVLKILVENGRPVEYGQDLFLVESGEDV